MILLDTHIVLWSLQNGDRIGRKAKRIISEAGVRYLSAVTHLEIVLKGSVSNLQVPDDLAALAEDAGLTALPFEDRHARAVTRFRQLDRHDPFDRMLLAQADVDRLTFLTADRALLALDQPWIIDATA